MAWAGHPFFHVLYKPLMPKEGAHGIQKPGHARITVCGGTTSNLKDWIIPPSFPHVGTDMYMGSLVPFTVPLNLPQGVWNGVQISNLEAFMG